MEAMLDQLKLIKAKAVMAVDEDIVATSSSGSWGDLGDARRLGKLSLETLFVGD